MPINFRLLSRWLLLGLACCIGAAAAAEDRVVLFFGDSLTAGYGLENPGSEAYPALIQKKIEAAGLHWRVANAGLSGDTTAAGLRRVDWVLRQPVDLFVLALGANDGLRGIDPALTRANLQAIIDRVHAVRPAARIVLAGMTMPPTLGEDYVRAFRAVFPALAEKNRLPLVPFLLEGVGGQPRLNQRDGIHPTAEGHTVVAENVWKVLQPLL
ncbi:MAG TPA: arylesterase [Opitutaceae bacterium]|nr:arylesterase [Opitutaceae bacterium]